MRIELTTSSLPRKCSTPELQRQFQFFLSGRRGSNPRPTAWKAVALPTELLPQTGLRLLGICNFSLHIPQLTRLGWGEKDSNLRRFPNGFTVRPIWPLWYLPVCIKMRATCRDRTSDLLITNQLLYQLS